MATDSFVHYFGQKLWMIVPYSFKVNAEPFHKYWNIMNGWNR